MAKKAYGLFRFVSEVERRKAESDLNRAFSEVMKAVLRQYATHRNTRNVMHRILYGARPRVKSR